VDPPDPPAVWTGDAHTLDLSQNGVRRLEIECDRKTGLTVLGAFKPVGGQRQMSIGAGDVVVTLDATPEGAAVKGQGARDPDFLRALGEGRKVAVNYDGQDIGPYDGPSRALAARFVAACGL